MPSGHGPWPLVLGPWSIVISRSRLIGLFALLGLAILLPSLGRAQEQPPNRAGLIVQHGDGRVVTACVSFAEPEISGLELLSRAGFSFLNQSGGGGSAVCKLDGEGCDYPTEDCFCKCKGAECVYWAYQHLRGGKWAYSQLGASAVKVKPGDVEGWAWGAGSVQAGAQPPALSLDQICAPQAQPPPTLQASVEIPPTALPAAAPTEAAPTATTQAARPTRAPTSAPVAIQATPTEAAPTATQAPTARPQAAVATVRPEMPSAAAVPSAPAATFVSAGGAAPTREPVAGAAPWTSYLAFGAIALVLVGGIAAALLRRSGR